MMCLLVEIHDTWVLEAELSVRAQVTVAVTDLCLPPSVCQSCVVVPSRPYNAHCRASEESV